MPEQNKNVTIVILHFGNLSTTLDCLESISQIDYTNHAVIVVNNGDTEKVSEDIIERYPQVEIIQNRENHGYAKANNLGIAKAINSKTDYIMIMNNDTIVQKDFMRILVHYCEEHPKSIVSPVLYKYRTNEIENLGGQILFPLGIAKRIRNPENTTPDFLSGACFLCNKEYFKDIGYFDEQFFMYFEDVDWSFRAKQKGYILKTVPESRIEHKHSLGTKVVQQKGWAPFKSYYIARNSLLFAQKTLRGWRKVVWLYTYLFIGSSLHLVFFCRSLESFSQHFQGQWAGLLTKPTYPQDQ